GAVPRSVLLTLSAGQHREVDIELDPQAAIRGTVFREAGTTDTALSGAEVVVYTVDGFPGTPVARVLTDEDGEYVIRDLEAPEEYIVEFGFPEGALPQRSIRVTLSAGEQRRNVNATLVLA